MVRFSVEEKSFGFLCRSCVLSHVVSVFFTSVLLACNFMSLLSGDRMPSIEIHKEFGREAAFLVLSPMP